MKGRAMKIGVLVCMIIGAYRVLYAPQELVSKKGE